MSPPAPNSLAELAALRHNAKAFGELLAVLQRAGLLSVEAGPGDSTFVATCRMPRASDFQSPWLQDACRLLQIEPRMHRQVWEYAYVLAALRSHGLLQPGRRALGVATHSDPLASCLAAHGVEVVLADAGEPATVREAALRPHLVERARFEALVSVEPLAHVWQPARWAGQFDLCWTTQALERQGSAARGLELAHAMSRFLRPGGLGALTTEFDLGLVGPAPEGASLSLFCQSHLQALAAELTAHGHALAPLDLSWGNGVLDAYIDMPPYPGDPGEVPGRPEPAHLKMLVDGVPVTRIGLLLHAASVNPLEPAGHPSRTSP